MGYIKGAALAATLLASSSALATTFDLTAPVSGDSSGYNYEDIGSGLSLSVSAYSNACEGCSDIINSHVTMWGSGLGVEDMSAPHHAIDNGSSDFDFLFFEFNQAVELDAMTIGWYENDSDMSVFAYTGTDTGTVGDDLVGQSWSDITSNGWEWDGHYLDVSEWTGDTATVNYGDISSRYWLIGAQYWPFSDPAQTFGTNYNYGHDFVKLHSVEVSTVEVSEPAGLALLGLSLLGFAVSRRKAA